MTALGQQGFELNGEPHVISGVSPNLTLLQYLRLKHLLGAKEGCAEGDCGACSVVVIEQDASGQARYRAINSCLVPVAAMIGRAILTVEGIKAGEKCLHPVQQAMIDQHASQCGYCTPGIVMSMLEAFLRCDLDSEAKLASQLCGNLCRCTGYRSIRDAALQALASGSPAAVKRDFRTPGLVFPTAVRYVSGEEHFYRPASLPELFGLLAEHPHARILAGATELGLRLTKYYERFPVLISVEGIPALREASEDERCWKLGAALTLTEIGEYLAGRFGAFEEMLDQFGSRQIRNRATLGGNLCTASPIGDCAPVLLAVDAAVLLASGAGERLLPLREFFLGYRRNALRPGEVLRQVIIPKGLMQGDDCHRQITRFYKVARRREMAISTVAAGFTLVLGPEGRIEAARVAYGGVAPLPRRAEEVERVLAGKTFSTDLEAEIRPWLAKAYQPISDVRGSAGYRAALVLELFGRFLADAETGAAPVAELLGNRWPTVPSPRFAGAWPHESGAKHVTGQAQYVDDLAAKRRALDVWPVCAPYARARILHKDGTAARRAPGIAAVLFAEDVPGQNDVGMLRHDEPLLAAGEVYYHGQIVALVVGESLERCREAALLVGIEYEPLPPVLSLQEAIAAGSFHTEPNYMRRGDAAEALAAAPRRFSGEFELGGQDHFYLETHAAYAEPGEGNTIKIVSSTQHPSEVQLVVARLLNVAANSVIVECPRMGGGFGGKETQGVITAGLAAVAAGVLGRAVRMRFNRDQDMMITGKRHPFLARFDVGFDDQGKALAARIALVSNGGWSLDLSAAVTDRALFHLDNAYYLPNVEFSGRVARTNVASNTAFRGFGGPQGMAVIEEVMDRVARAAGLAPEVVRERNLYHGEGASMTTHYGQVIEDHRIERVWCELLASSDFAERRRALADWNRKKADRKRGLAITPVKFGIAFTVTHCNQAGALVVIYQDGSVQVNHGGTEMGQGIHTNILAIAARELGITPGRIRVMSTSTDKVPNTSATAASSGTDLNGAAVRNACAELRLRLAEVAVTILTERGGRPVAPASLEVSGDVFRHRDDCTLAVSFPEVVHRAYLERVSLSATGHYRTPGIHWNRAEGRGKPFHYYAVGAAVSEVEVDGRTGVHQVRRVDILHDVGSSINPAVNLGQIEGGFVQGMGWLTTEELVWDEQGRLQTHSPDSYKIPAFSDTPADFRVTFLSDAAQPGNVYGSKAVGEPPLMLALSVREAIRDAVASFGGPVSRVDLPLPATAEAIYWAVQAVRTGANRIDLRQANGNGDEGWLPAPAINTAIR
ncbi:MAG: xanthine dehydrogenase molybdopterin binding subunit [Verrucomicrobia bacterium]|nr:xanthine dehydrogenase molybdopterin binding subunit [Verrucomicrobiota bacterium]